MTKAEPQVMNRHVTYSVVMAKGYEQDILDIIACHHEHWNGQGYRRGLLGEAIRYLARVTAVADAYDAMTNDRPYHPRFSHSEALAIIQRAAGSQFDLQLASAFVTMLS